MTALGFRPLNVALRAGSPALTAYAASAAILPDDLAPGFHPRPDLNLTNRGGRTITRSRRRGRHPHRERTSFWAGIPDAAAKSVTFPWHWPAQTSPSP